jgi:hypothetical protein
VNARLTWTCALIAGCAFGGSDADPTHGLKTVSAGPSMDAGVGGGEGGDDGDDGPPVILDASVHEDAAKTSDAGAGEAGVSDAGASDAGASDAGAGDAGSSDAGASEAGPAVDGGGTASCTPGTGVPVCDPVRNSGCSLFTQCDIDTDAAVQAGRCVSWTLGSSACSASSTSTTCDARSACVDGTCRKLCYCDSDCAAGTKCNGTAPGPAGSVKICQ